MSDLNTGRELAQLALIGGLYKTMISTGLLPAEAVRSVFEIAATNLHADDALMRRQMDDFCMQLQL